MKVNTSKESGREYLLGMWESEREYLQGNWESGRECFPGKWASGRERKVEENISKIAIKWKGRESGRE